MAQQRKESTTDKDEIIYYCEIIINRMFRLRGFKSVEPNQSSLMKREIKKNLHSNFNNSQKAERYFYSKI